MSKRIKTGARHLMLLILSAVCIMAGGRTVRAASMSIQGEKSMLAGEEQTLTLANQPEDLPEDVTFVWTTSDSKVVSLSGSTTDTNTATAVGAGTATVTASLTIDGTEYTASKNIKVGLAVPALKSAVSVSGTSAEVTWEGVAGAERYRLYRRIGDGSWKAVSYTTDTSYTDTGLSCGTTYNYTVRAFSGSVKSSYNEQGVSVQIIPAAPVLTGTTSVNKTSLKIEWKSLEGVDGYRVYRKNSNGKWKALKTVEDTSYVDTTVEYKKSYTYTVRGYVTVDGKKVLGAYDETGITGKTLSASAVGKTLSAPKLISAVGTSYSRITVTWETVSGADGYIVYRKTSGSSWKKIKTIKSADTVSYVDKKCTFGTSYTYTVRAYINYSGSKAKGSYDTKGVSAKPKLAAPTLKGVTSGTAKIVVKWGTVSGASGYRVYRKTEGGKWKALKTYSGKVTSYTDTSVSANTTYYYTVRAYRKVNGKKVWGSYDKTGVSGSTKVTSKYVNGLKLYYDADGNLITDVEDIIGSQSSYYIKVNKNTNVVTVYAKDTNGQYVVPVKSFVCSTGSATPTGTYTTPAKYRWRELMGPCWGQWCTRIYGGILFHSVYYDKYNDNTSLSVSAYNKLGTTCSHGCVRLTAGDAKWIYDNCKLGTKVTIYSGSSSTDPFGKPTASKLSSSHTWDPTDPNVYYKCKANGCH